MMLSLAGLPMTLGFIGKFYVLAVGAGPGTLGGWWRCRGCRFGNRPLLLLRVAVSLYLHAPERSRVARCTVKLAVQHGRYAWC
ncbi:hypothetical protein ACNKHP_04470 [Shigella boydii]